MLCEVLSEFSQFVLPLPRNVFIILTSLCQRGSWAMEHTAAYICQSERRTLKVDFYWPYFGVRVTSLECGVKLSSAALTIAMLSCSWADDMVVELICRGLPGSCSDKTNRQGRRKRQIDTLTGINHKRLHLHWFDLSNVLPAIALSSWLK